MREHQAREQWTVERTLEMVPKTEQGFAKRLAQLSQIWTMPDSPRMLDIGAGQGMTLIAAARRGLEAVGVEPWEPARRVAQELAEHVGEKITMLDGVAEHLPVDSDSCDIVHAISVIEHVQDAQAALNEMFRVTKPGGVIWFNCASSMCPRQREIAGFPFFGWYPDRLKRRIMYWATANKPHLVGYTDTPAIHWFTPRKARRMLRQAGFQQKVYDYWDLRMETEGGTAHGYALRLVRAAPFGKTFAHMMTHAMAYATVKQTL